MKKKFSYSIVFIAALTMSFTFSITESIIELPTSNFKLLSDSTHQEKIHLHLDKPYYVAGDNIWFKAYVLDEHSLSPSKSSSVLYVDLIHDNKAVRTLKLPLENGITWGDFKLSDSIPEGNYRIRAYTQWMRNEADAYFFDKTVAIGNEIRLGKTEKEAENTKPNHSDPQGDVQFFPEGGKIVKGIPVKISVRSADPNASAEIVKGTVSDIGGETMNFTTNESGLGHFMLNATSTGLHKINIIKNGIRKEYSLPKIEENGYSLMLKPNGSLQIYLSTDKLNTGTLSLVGQRNGLIYFKQAIPTVKQMASIAIPTEKLPSGILQLSLLTADGQVLCERFTFVNHEHDKLDLGVEALKASYGKRSPVELTIGVKQQGLPVSGNFSLSVTNTSIVGTDLDNETNILASFLLNADALNPIKNPNHYLGKDAIQDVDLLMLTGNWRNRPWKSVIAPPRYQPEKTMRISGTLTNNGKPVPNGNVTLVKSAGGFDMLSTTSDAHGRFLFDSLSFGDSTKLLLQARTAADKKNVKILVDQPTGPDISVRDVPVWSSDINGRIMDYLHKSKEYYKEQAKRTPLTGVTQLKEVEITGGRNQKYNYNRMHIRADEEFTSKELDSAAFLSQVLNGKVRGNYRKYRVMLDGYYVGAESFFLNTDPATIERIEVISSIGLLAAYRSQNPIFIVTSKRNPSFSNVKYAPGVTTLTPKGFSFSRTFESPDYELQNDPRPDLRPTVYWNPNLSTDENGRFKIKYFNTDMPGKYRIVIEGIGGNRGLARKEIYYEVK